MIRPVRPVVHRVVCLLVALLVPALVEAQWATVGDMPPPKRAGNTLTFANGRITASVTVVSPRIVRVRFLPAPALERDGSYAVVTRDPGSAEAAYDITASGTTIRTSALQVTIRHRPFRIQFADSSGTSLDEDDPAMGTAFSGAATRVFKRLRDDELVYGLGEKNGMLNRRGKKLGGYSYTMWNSDTFGYDASIDPIYASFPFYLVLRQGRAHGIFLDNTHRTNFDIGHQYQHLVSFGAEAGELDYYFIDGPTPKDVVSRYTQLTGRMPLPPLWALGFHQCRYSYYPESRVRFIAQNFRERSIPADVIWLDIHYLDGYNPFTWDRERFPDPKRLLGDLARDGFRTVVIIDPHPKKQPGWPVYDSGMAGGHFVRNADGSIYEAPVWPSQAERSPGPSVFPDFSRAATREWWGGLYKELLETGVAGIWNDMNEPAIFETVTGTMPLDVRHDNEGKPTSHREIHNVYGMLMTQATYEGLSRLRPDERPFVLTRATFSGGQRYAALWPGDNVSNWPSLQMTIPMLASLGLSGMPFVGSDIGGFAGSATAELFTRWLQAAVFYPFMRAHTTFGTDDAEPWSYGKAHEIINRRAIELRYELLPHIYNVMRETSETGIPAMRPLVLEFPDDPGSWEREDEFMFGRDLLIAPVLEPEARERGIYLPPGTWFDFWTGQRYEGKRHDSLPVTLSSIPIFVREGAFVFRQPVVQHTGQMSGQPLRVFVYPGAASRATLYEDDGSTNAHRNGVSLSREFAQERSAGQDGDDVRVEVTVGAPAGSYRPAARALELYVQWSGRPRSVGVAAGSGALAAVERRARAELEGQTSGWAMEKGRVIVRMPDRFEPFRVVIER